MQPKCLFPGKSDALVLTKSVGISKLVTNSSGRPASSGIHFSAV
jgi:hypothetical protein